MCNTSCRFARQPFAGDAPGSVAPFTNAVSLQPFSNNVARFHAHFWSTESTTNLISFIIICVWSSRTRRELSYCNGGVLVGLVP